MNDRLNDFYNIPNLDRYENRDLIALREVCATQEEKVYALMDGLSTEDRLILESYLDLRNDLEVETINAALRWGKGIANKHIKPLPFRRGLICMKTC